RSPFLRRKSLQSTCSTRFQPCEPLSRRCETRTLRFKTRIRRREELTERCAPKPFDGVIRTFDCAIQVSSRESEIFFGESLPPAGRRAASGSLPNVSARP